MNTFLYCPQGKVFIVDMVHDLTGQHEPPRIITMAEAVEIMDQHPEGIKEECVCAILWRP